MYFLEKLTDKQILQLVQKGKTTIIKGFKTNEGKLDGVLSFNENFEIILNSKTKKKEKSKDELLCPKCKKGKIIKGKTAYGCSEYVNGCDYRYSFDDIRKNAQGKALTKELVLELLIKG